MGASVWVLWIVVALPAFAAADAVQDLASGDLAVRRRAATALADETTLPPEMVAPLVARFRDDLVVADAAVRALGHGGPPARAALEPLLASSDAELRVRAYQAIGRLVATDPGAWPLVYAAFRDDALRGHVLWAVAKGGGAVAVPGLIAALADEDARVRLGATSALRWMGASARSAVPALVAALRDADERVRREAAFALAAVDSGRPETVAALAALLPDSEVACTLSALDVPPTAAADALIRTMLATGEGSACAARALGRIGAGDPAVERALVEALGKPDGTLQAAAAEALGPWGSGARDAVPDLVRLLGDEGGWLRGRAVETLAKIGAPAVPALIAALASDDFYVRGAAADALRDMQPFPEAATDALIRALDDSNTDVRGNAAAALGHAEGARVEAALARFDEAEKRRESETEAQATRIFSKAELIAGSPPDSDHKYPLEVDSFGPIEGTELLTSTYHGTDRPGEVVVWAKVPQGYLRLRTFTDEPGMGSYAPIKAFRYDYRSFLLVEFIPRAARYAPDDHVFAIDSSEEGIPVLIEVEIESPIDWFHHNLRPDESLMDDYFLTVATDRLEWSFMLYKPGDCHAGPTGGGVQGTFDLCEEKHHDDATNRWTSQWRMVVREGERTPTGAPRRPSSTVPGHVLPVCPRTIVAARLPDASGAQPAQH
jgi:HEAT repeat protein